VGGKPAPWRQKFDREVCRQIESVLTPRQLQTLKDASFPQYAVGLLYNSTIRQKIGFRTEQEDRFRHIAKERLARFQAESIGRAEKQWAMLTPEQQAELPEVVRRQGPTSAALSIAWELGFQFDTFVPGYPMLAEEPVRERLKLSAEQWKQLQSIMANSAARMQNERQGRLSGSAQLPQSSSDWESDAKKQIEAMLTPQQLATLNEINFRRQVVLALGYPKRGRQSASPHNRKPTFSGSKRKPMSDSTESTRRCSAKRYGFSRLISDNS